MKRIKTDICIVGTGFCGTFMANVLKDTSARIVMIEKGAYLSRERIEDNFLKHKEDIINFSSGKDFYKLIDSIYDDPEFARYDHVNNGKNIFNYSGRHAVGGNSLLWFGSAIRKVPNDFRTRSIYGFGEDWPISYNDLEEYYYQAELEMGVSGPPTDALSTFREKPFPLPPFQLPPGAIELNSAFKGSGFEITPSHKARLPMDSNGRSACCGAGTCWLYCPADSRYSCLTTHIRNLSQSKQVDIFDKLTLSRLTQKDDTIVDAVAFDREGNEIRIQAELFILAANAVENARILLLSQFHFSVTDFKMRSPAVGKYLADQVGMWIPVHMPFNLYNGYEKTLKSSHSLSYYDGPFRDRYSGIVVEISFAEPPFSSSLITDEKKAQRLILDQVKKRYFGENLKKQIYLNSLGKVQLCLEMEMMAEERNCIKLHRTKKNRFGDPIAEFYFSIWDQEYLNRSRKFYIQRFKKIVSDAGGHLGPVTLRGSFDHMLGTCRMGTNPINSVVDENLKSHDHKNLYIVGGSAFPTAGSTNPTLTIVALALRCAHYLKGQFNLA